jgi:Fic family protein
MKYQPPYTITPEILNRVAAISEAIGRLAVLIDQARSLRLRRINRVRTIRGSLAIEGNTLSEAQITAILEGKRVIAPPREVQEVKNALAAYDRFDTWKLEAEKDMLEAHRILMSGLIDEAGLYRHGGVGVMAGRQVIHMAPPADRVPQRMADLFAWLAATDVHPLIASSVFHYEFEFIHPFADGNGRMGRLWQTLILSKWKPPLAYLPVETVIRDRQDDYYGVLGKCDQAANSTLFVEFMLNAILKALRENILTDQVNDQVTDQVVKILNVFEGHPLSASEMMKNLGLSHRPTFRNNYLHPALAKGLIEMTIPDKPNSRLQKYRITQKGIYAKTSK